MYNLKVSSDKADEAVAAVAEAIASPPSDSYVVGEMKASAGVTYAKVASTPELQLVELLHDAAFGEGTPLGASAYASTLDKLCQDEVMAYRQAHFTAPRITVAASGGLSHDSLKQMVECYLYSVPAGAASAVPASPYQGGDMKVRADLDGQTYLGLAFPVPAGDAAKPYSVVHSALSSKIASMGLPSGSLSAFYAPYSTGGIFGVYASGTPAAASSALEAAVAELKAIASGTTGVDGYKAKAALEFQSDASAQALLTASYADVKSVSAAAVASAASAALKAVPTYAVLGATLGTPSYAAVAKMVK